MSDERYVWVLSGRTESGDDYVFAFSHEPTPEEIDLAFSEDMTEDYEADCMGSWNISCELIR